METSSATRTALFGTTAALVVGHLMGATNSSESVGVNVRTEWPISPKTEEWIAQNATSMVAFENVLKNAPYVLPSIKAFLDTIIGPGKLPDAGLTNQALATFTDLLGLVNTVSFARYFPVQKEGVSPPTAMGNAYLRTLMQQSRPYAQMAIMMAVVIAFERYAEMKALKSYGEESRWNVVLGIETFKAIARLLLLKSTSGSPLLQRALPDRDYDLSKSPTLLSTSNDPVAMLAGGSDPLKPRMGLEGLKLAGEIAWIVRPAIYTYLVRKEGKESWNAWKTSLAIDLFAALARRMTNGPNDSWLDRDEGSRRDALLFWYLIRDPFFSTRFKAPLMKIVGQALRRPPFLFVAIAIYEYLSFWENYYFFTNGSS